MWCAAPARAPEGVRPPGENCGHSVIWNSINAMTTLGPNLAARVGGAGQAGTWPSCVFFQEETWQLLATPHTMAPQT